MIKIVTTSQGREVKVIGQSVHEVTECMQFKDWLDRFDFERMDLQLIAIQSADIFEGGKVIFVKAETEVYDRTCGKRISGIIFLRGNAVSVFVVVICEETGDRFIVKIRQPRVPLGLYEFSEIPAGMLDKGDGVIGRAIAELEEETDIKILKKDLIFLGDWVPSAGGCDEHIASFYTEVTLSRAAIDGVLGKIHGAAGEHEQISVELLTIEKFIGQILGASILDAKALVSIALMVLKQNPQTVIDILKGGFRP